MTNVLKFSIQSKKPYIFKFNCIQINFSCIYQQFRAIPQPVFPWIGFHDEKDDDVFVWVNGEKVEDGFTNWISSKSIKQENK